MKKKLKFSITAQPDDISCGPTCLHALYNYYGDNIPLDTLIEETPRLENGGTLGVHLANHALMRGYSARMFTFSLQMFDPTWFSLESEEIIAKLREQAAAKKSRKMKSATGHYIRFLELGGELEMEDLTAALVRRHLNRGMPVLAGLSATYLYREPREREEDNEPDDVCGSSVGHFVVLCGYDRERRVVTVADPLHSNPVAKSHYYEVDIYRLVNSILLGVLTYDANLMIIQPRNR